MKTPNNKRAFTVIEILVTLAIACIAVGLIATIAGGKQFTESYHNGHRYLRPLWSGSNPAIIHDPDCPKCQQPQVRTNGKLEAQP